MDTNKEYQTHLLLLAMLIPHFLQEEINHKKKLHQIPHESINHVQEPVRDLQTDAWIFPLRGDPREKSTAYCHALNQRSVNLHLINS